jgi:tight adherence protein C
MLLVILAVILVFATVALLIFGVISQKQAGSDPVAARLAEIKSSTEGAQWWQTRRTARRPAWERLLARLAGFLPNADGQESIKDGLVEAGFRGPNAVTTFLGAKILFAAGLPLFLFVIAAMLRFPIGNTLIWSIVLAVVGFYLPTLWLWNAAGKRKLEVTHALPDALDLLVVCVEAGLGLDQAMRKVAEEMRKSYRNIADEFNLCNMQLQMGRSRTQVLQELGIRSGVDDLKSLASILIQADKFGSSIAQALRVQSDSMRTRRRQIAEEKAAKTAVKLIFPLVLFIFPGIFVVLVGPAAITMVREMFPMMNRGGG